MRTGGIPPLPRDLLEDPTLEEIPGGPASTVLLAFEAAWSAWPKQGALPPRSAFDPVDFPRFLPWIGLQEFTAHPNRYRSYDMLYRYLGTARSEMFKAAGLTGTYVSAMPDPFPERWFKVYDRLLARRGPVVIRGKP